MDEQTQTPPADPPTTPPATPDAPPAEPAEPVITPATPPQVATTPAAPATPATPAPAAPQAPPAGGSKKKVLLVEDDDNLASVYMTRLQAEGFDTKRVPNGEEALATALAYKPDLILLDVMMPKVSGFDVLDILRNTPETNNVKVIMLTALSQDSDKDRATQLGADDYLVKSQVVIADVVERIRHHLNMA